MEIPQRGRQRSERIWRDVLNPEINTPTLGVGLRWLKLPRDLEELCKCKQYDENSGWVSMWLTSL